MRWCALILFFNLVLTTTNAEPEPKKYQPDVQSKTKQTNTSLTDDEKSFLREVESKFGIKSDISVKLNGEDKVKSSSGPSFPAVIAIEIVNDTDSKSKEKRTIDANLGYGYRTNNGYTYTYFGKSAQDKGKFTIYPYSQEDIPPSRHNNQNTRSSGKYSSPNVEIQPSQAYELVSVKEEQNSYYKRPVTELSTKYEKVQGLESPPPPYSINKNNNINSNSIHSANQPILYTTYNGEQFTGLSGNFPAVMPNYFVDPSQLLKNPHYQSVGLTQDHLRPHGPNLDQRVIPVLVLRVPSSYLKNPSAELYANLPKNYPLSQHLNNLNLQQLVNQYFKKIGYPFAPEVMAYQQPLLSSPVATPTNVPASRYEPQHYSNPYVQPSYTQADYSGIQYSAVQPVMAKYPSTYTKQHYVIPHTQSLYQPQQQQPQYEYKYQYFPQSAMTQTYYVQPQYQQQPTQTAHQEQTEQVTDQQTSVHEVQSNNQYAQQTIRHETPGSAAVEYGPPQSQNTQNYETVEYESPKTSQYEYVSDPPTKTVSQEYGPAKIPIPVYTTSQAAQIKYGSSVEESSGEEYYSAKQAAPQETVSIYPSSYSGQLSGGAQNYIYQKQETSDAASNTLVISENYPSKDHTLATVLPFNYKPDRKQSKGTLQTVSYVTPVPHKYQSPYQVMVPQTVLKSPDNEKVSYVNSHSMPSYSQANSQQDYHSEEEYTVGTEYIPPVGKQKPPSYPRNYHAHPKRMVKDNKSENMSSRKVSERSEKKKST